MAGAARIPTAVEQQDVYVVDGMFGLVDEACNGEGVPARLPGITWVVVRRLRAESG